MPVIVASSMNSATIQGRGVPIASMVPISRVRSIMAISSVFTLAMSTMKNTMMPEEEEDSAEQGAHLLVVGGEVDPLLHRHLLREAAKPRSECRRDRIGVFGLVESDDEVGDAIALQQALRRGKRDAQIAVVEILEAGVDDAHDLHVDAVERAIGGHGQDGEAVANFHAHRRATPVPDQGFNFAAGDSAEIAARARRGLKPMPRSASGSTALPMNTEDFTPLESMP